MSTYLLIYAVSRHSSMMVRNDSGRKERKGAYRRFANKLICFAIYPYSLLLTHQMGIGRVLALNTPKDGAVVLDEKNADIFLVERIAEVSGHEEVVPGTLDFLPEVRLVQHNTFDEAF